MADGPVACLFAATVGQSRLCQIILPNVYYFPNPTFRRQLLTTDLRRGTIFHCALLLPSLGLADRPPNQRRGQGWLPESLISATSPAALPAHLVHFCYQSPELPAVANPPRVAPFLHNDSSAVLIRFTTFWTHSVRLPTCKPPVRRSRTSPPSSNPPSPCLLPRCSSG